MALLTTDLKPAFSRFFGAAPDRLHVAAHSHHPWPDVSFEAHAEAWNDAARWADEKWGERVFAEVIPEAARHVAGRLGLTDPAAIAFAPNTHDLVMRLISALPGGTIHFLTTDAEFHSFNRQLRRLAEEGLATMEVVRAEPYSTFPDRFAATAAWGGHQVVYFSQVHFNSAYLLSDLVAVVSALPNPETYVVIDGYHGFMAAPTALSAIENRAFYVAGGYKYAMAGEGACFMHCPPGYALRPVDTGWFAGFSDLATSRTGDSVPFARDGSRFWGATFDPTPLYRHNAVQRWLDEAGVDVAAIHAHVGQLQELFLGGLDDRWRDALTPPIGSPRGNFLVFRFPDEAEAGSLQGRLAEAAVVTDHREDRLRIGFGVYHDASDVDELLSRLKKIGAL